MSNVWNTCREEIPMILAAALRIFHNMYMLIYKAYITNIPWKHLFLTCQLPYDSKCSTVRWNWRFIDLWIKRKVDQKKKNYMYNGFRTMFSQNITYVFPEIFVIFSISVLVCMESIISGVGGKLKVGWGWLDLSKILTG